jgi:hypothetical protein
LPISPHTQENTSKEIPAASTVALTKTVTALPASNIHNNSSCSVPFKTTDNEPATERDKNDSESSGANIAIATKPLVIEEKRAVKEVVKETASPSFVPKAKSESSAMDDVRFGAASEGSTAATAAITAAAIDTTAFSATERAAAIAPANDRSIDSGSNGWGATVSEWGNSTLPATESGGWGAAASDWGRSTRPVAASDTADNDAGKTTTTTSSDGWGATAVSEWGDANPEPIDSSGSTKSEGWGAAVSEWGNADELPSTATAAATAVGMTAAAAAGWGETVCDWGNSFTTATTPNADADADDIILPSLPAATATATPGWGDAVSDWGNSFTTATTANADADADDIILPSLPAATATATPGWGDAVSNWGNPVATAKTTTPNADETILPSLPSNTIANDMGRSALDILDAAMSVLPEFNASTPNILDTVVTASSTTGTALAYKNKDFTPASQSGVAQSQVQNEGWGKESGVGWGAQAAAYSRLQSQQNQKQPGWGSAPKGAQTESWGAEGGKRDADLQISLSSPDHHITTSPHHLITTSPHLHHITTSPHHHITTSPHHHITTSPHHHITTSPPHHITTSPHHHITTPPHHHITTSPHHHITSPHHHITTPPHHHTTTSPHLHIATSPHHHITTSVSHISRMARSGGRRIVFSVYCLSRSYFYSISHCTL